MNDNDQEKDKRLSQALKTWKVAAPLPPHFQEGVWRQITRTEEKGKASLWTIFEDWLAVALSRRVIAASYLAILLAAGLAAGYLNGHQKSRHVAADLSERYLQSVDPYQALAASK